jgi:eukaryotic-like serine/threonine-protein kinase
MVPDDAETREGPAWSRPIDAGRFAPGTLLAERYRIVSLAGRGGMGEVYRAEDQRVGQTVALKFLPPGLEQDPDARARLVAEVRSARAVSHPNVCRVYDVGEVDGRFFLTMEYIDGEDLASLLTRIERLPPSKALNVARQLCAGLAAAHDRGVLHRDLKPANVMIDGRGQARIADFGLAVDPALSPVDGAGTLAYMAPERFEGKPATERSDLYALGLILYEAYTGKRPFTASSAREWQRVHSDSNPTGPSNLVPEIEPAVERIILRCLEKDPAKRPSSASQVAAALPGGDPLAAALAAGETPSPELVAASGEEGTLPRRAAWLWLVGCLASLALAVPLGSPWHLANLVPSRDPVLQIAEAQKILRDVGYTNVPFDTQYWYRTDLTYMRTLVKMTPASARFAPRDTPAQGALIFCYRQSARPIVTLSPMLLPDDGDVEPAPLRGDEAVVELNPGGGLRTLRVGGLRAFRTMRIPYDAGTSWPRLFAAAGLDMSQFAETPPRFVPTFAFDAHVAWVGRLGDEPLRVEAAAYAGRPVEFRVVPASLPLVIAGPYLRPWPDQILDPIMLIAFLTSIAVLATMARRNARAGRGDRKGAARIAFVMLGAETIILALNRHWTSVPMQSLVAVFYSFGVAFSSAILVWLYYLGLEPNVRRRWPHLLISWTRLLEGRWRDPLVGRDVLAGTTYALWIAAIVPGLAVAATRWLSLPLAVPWGQSQLAPFLPSIAVMFADRITSFFGVFTAWFALAFLVVIGLVVRQERVVWLLLTLVFVVVVSWSLLLLQPYVTETRIAPVLIGGLFSIATAVVLSRHGLLGCSAFAVVSTALLNTPLTADLTRWYAWRTVAVAMLVMGFALWGFRNVLGSQTAFPAGEL